MNMDMGKIVPKYLQNDEHNTVGDFARMTARRKSSIIGLNVGDFARMTARRKSSITGLNMGDFARMTVRRKSSII